MLEFYQTALILFEVFDNRELPAPLLVIADLCFLSVQDPGHISHFPYLSQVQVALLLLLLQWQCTSIWSFGRRISCPLTSIKILLHSTRFMVCPGVFCSFLRGIQHLFYPPSTCSQLLKPGRWRVLPLPSMVNDLLILFYPREKIAYLKN